MYLSSIHIQNFRGIKNLNVNFHPKYNVIIGCNGCHKTSLIDAIRLFYTWGDQQQNLYVSAEDFYQEVVLKDDNIEIIPNTTIIIEYNFKGLDDIQKGAFYQYLLVEDDELFARVTLNYTLCENGKIQTSFHMGKEIGQKADYETYNLFISYYLGALRDSTRDLLNTKDNLLGRVIKRKIEKTGKEGDIKNIIKEANEQLLNQEEVISTKQGINKTLEKIDKTAGIVGLHIEQNRLEYIVNVIKPFLLHTNINNNNEGYRLSQNSLGYNNIIYIATVLSDIKERHEKETHIVLLIEEPEAHLHPQLQVNLYNFLVEADDDPNSQIFITTHSPTLTSKVPLENLILLHNNESYCIIDCLKDREKEGIIREHKGKKILSNELCNMYKNMLQRYLDVTRSQLFFAKGCFLIEGISESLLMQSFSEIIDCSLSDNQIEIVDVDGTAFYQFITLFNSKDERKRLPMKLAIATDGDQFTDSKNSEYNLEYLIMEKFAKLKHLREKIKNSEMCGRAKNITYMANKQPNIYVAIGNKTLEYQICRANVFNTIDKIESGYLFKYIKSFVKCDCLEIIKSYITNEKADPNNLTNDAMMDIAIILWKCLPKKSEFAQNLAAYLDQHKNDKDFNFIVPEYLQKAIKHLTI